MSEPPAKRARPNVYCTRDLPQVAFELLKGKVDLKVWEGEDAPPRDVLLKEAKGRDGLITLLTDKIDDELLDAAGPQLKIVTQCAVGFNNVDVPACTKRGVKVSNTPGVLTETTAETALTLLMAAGRRVVESDKYVRTGNWKVAWHPLMQLGQDIHDNTVGIIGMGRIGQHLAKIVHAMGAKVVYYDPNRIDSIEKAIGATYMSLQEVCKTSDFISVHTLLTPETKHLVNKELLSIMKPNCVLVNTSRGPVVDENALYEALKDKTIAAAGLDVFESEPVGADHPLMQLDNVVVLPHLGSATRATRDAMARLTAENQIAQWEGGKFPSLVNPELAQ